MKHKKPSARVLSLVLTMAMLLSMLPMGALAAEDSALLDGSTASETTDADKLEGESMPSASKQARAGVSVKRTTPLDLTAASISYVAADGTTPKTADPTTESIAATGEGWSWDFDTKTLTLDGANIDCSGTTVTHSGKTNSEERTYGIQLPAGAIIVLTAGTTSTIKSSKIIGPDASGEMKSIGISSLGTLTIKGTGTLDVTTGIGSGNLETHSYGIFSESDIIIDSGTITATGGNLSVTKLYATSAGIYSKAGITIAGGVIVNASSGDVLEGSGVYTFGLLATTLTMNGGTLNGAAGDVPNTGASTSDGVNARTITLSGKAVISAKGNTVAVYGSKSITAKGATITGSATIDGELGAAELLSVGTDEDAFDTVVLSSDKTTIAKRVNINFTPTISFDARNGKTIGAVEIVDGKITLPADPTWGDNQAKDNYTFVGWYTVKDDAGTEVTAETELTASATVYAKWTKGGKRVYTQPIDLTGTPTVTSGDGWAWSEGTLTLTLSGAIIDCSGTTVELSGKDHEEKRTYGIQLPAGATIVLTDKTTSTIKSAKLVKSADAEDLFIVQSIAVNSLGKLIIQGTGALDATAGVGSGSLRVSSCGILSDDAISIEGGIITATGSDVVVEEKYATSAGIYAEKAINITDGIVNAKSGNATGGTEVDATGLGTETLTMSGGTLNGVAGYAPDDSNGSVGVSARTITLSGKAVISAKGKTAAVYGGESITAEGATITGSETIDGKLGAAKLLSVNVDGDAFDTVVLSSNTDIIAKRVNINFIPTISFDTRNGDPIPAAEIVGGKITLPTAPTWGDNQAKDNYTFVGWFTEKDGAGTPVTADTVLTASATVYAKWTKDKKLVRTSSLDLTSMATTDKLSAEGWSWDSVSKTLTLDGANIIGNTAFVDDTTTTTTTTVFGVHLPTDATIVLDGTTTSTIRSGDAIGNGSSSTAVFSTGVLEISGDGTLVAMGGSSEGSTFGIECGDLTITASKITATGGKSTGDLSGGIFAEDTTITAGATVIANGGAAANVDDVTSSYGLMTNELTISDSVLTGTALDASTTEGFENVGVRALLSMHITNSTVSGTGKTFAVAVGSDDSDDSDTNAGIVAEGATVTGAKGTEPFESGKTKNLTQSGDAPVVISFGPSIAVAAQSVPATYGTAVVPTFAVTNSNFLGDYPAFVPSIVWTSGNVPTGVTADISADKTSITMNTTAATPAGEYKFKVVSPKNPSTDGNYESAVASLVVGQREATITWGETLSFPYNGRAQAPSATVSNKVGSDDVTVTVTGGQTNVGTGYTATASGFVGAAAGNYKLPSDKPTQAFTITKAAYSGTEATAPDASKATKTDATVTLAVQTVTGETVEYAYNTTNTAPTTWQDKNVFVSGLTSNKDYYFFARVKATTNHEAGASSTGTKIKTDMSDIEKVEAAKKAVEAALGGFIATNATDSAAIDAVVSKALSDAGITGVTASGTGAFTIRKATDLLAGSVTGTIKLTCGEVNDTVVLNNIIAKLPSDPAAKIAVVKAAIEAALNAYKPSNTTVAADIKAIADKANTDTGVSDVMVAWKTPSDFNNTNSTNTANGRLTGTFDLSCSDKTATVLVDLVVERTDAQKLTDIKLKVEIALAGMTASNTTTADEVMAVVNKVLVGTVVTAKWNVDNGFVNVPAAEGMVGSITGKITLTLNLATSDVTVDLVIAKIAVNKTALTEAITAANLAKKDVSINNNLAADVAEGTKFVTAAEMKTFTDAITAAQAVANDPNATTAQVTAVGTALATAVATFKTDTKTGTFPGTATHTPIGNIEILLGTATAGTDLTLSATITPASASNKTIVWTVKTAGTTGASIENGKLKTTAAGTVVLTATIASGTNATTDYTQDFAITVLAPSATVSGTVTDNTNIAVSGATVQLMQGETEIKKAITIDDGKYSFTDVPNGVYQLVITKAGATISESIIVSGSPVEKTVKLSGTKNTIVVSTTGTPEVAVGGMNALLNPENLGTTLAPEEKVAVDDGGSVVLTFTAELKTASEVADDKTKIEGLATGKKIDMLIDLSVLKTVKNSGGTQVGISEKIPSLVSVIEVVIPIPAQLQGKADLSIYRVHNGDAEALQKDLADANGEYYTISADGTYATLHIKNFSTYAFGYTAPVTPPSGGGSSGGTASYPNTINKPENGTVTMTPANPVKGQTVTITTKPDAGYEVDQIIVKDADGNRIAVTKTATGGYTFVQPAGKITVEVTYKKAGTSGAASFADVTENDWFYKAVMTATAKGWFNGTSDTTFSPNQSTNRGMIATILHRIDSTPGATTADFIDVAADAYYANGVAWAQANGIVTGYGNGSYGPTDDITREQLAAILYRFAKYKNYDTSKTAALSSFTDASTVSSYANEAMSWAVGAGLISGRESNTLAPNASATRAEVATILVRFAEMFVK